MPNKGTHNPDNLLKHLPEYGVVICRACKFAVQPQALASHLLRHQVYRNDRQQLLDRLAQLDIQEPEDVRLPSSDTPPLPHLSLHNGYVCMSAGCAHSCVSQKRMFQHWAESHDEHDSKNVQARPALLQTFFRGNKIRYFEVNGSVAEGSTPGSFRRRGSDRSMSPGFQQLETSGDETERSQDSTTSTLDTRAMRYFRHYVLLEQFWDETIVETAYEHHFLMYGILSIAATHMASIAPDLNTCRTHREAAIHYKVSGANAMYEAMNRPDTIPNTALLTFSRFAGFQTLMQQELETRYGPNANDPSLIIDLFHMLRRGPQHLLPPGSPQINDDVEALDTDMANSLFHIPASLFARIEALPRLLQPHIADLTELEALNQAAAALLTSASRSYGGGGSSLWSGVETFPRLAPESFVRMLEAWRPAALVVLAHWGPLLGRLEGMFLFLAGWGVRVVGGVRGVLGLELGAFVEGLEFG